ncbi:hypothetical protein BU17DRAFT_43979 [Hysterangium stoloniferum]|nr:hypothetical protein BU17DRAFT_43979 [Hysterangium stoloniferum]
MGDLFMVVVAAYATQNVWQKALDRLLSMPTAVRLTQDKVKVFCNEHVKDDAVLAAKVQLWAEELVVCRLVSRSASLHSYLSTLAKDNQFRTIMNLYRRIVDECRKVDGRLSVKQPTNGQGVTFVSPNTWTYFIQAFFKCSRVDLVDRLWKEVTELNLLPHPEMWFAVLDGYARHHGGQFLKAQATWNRMLSAGIEPDEFAYGSMIHAYFYARRPLEAVSLFEQFTSFKKKTLQGKAALHDRLMLPLYNIVINGLCTNQQEDKARALLKELMDSGPQPDIVTYNIFLRYYARVGDMHRLAGVLRALKPAGVEADNYSFTTVLSALYKAGQDGAHITILQTMADTGIQPNVAMYSAIINFLVRQGGRENFQKAISLLTKMENESDKACRPNEVTYTGLLAGIHRDPSLSATEVKMYSDDLFRRMQKNGVNPNRATFHYLIKASLENSEAHGLQLAMKYYGQMQKNGISLNDRTWFILLSGLVRRNEKAVAKEVLREMFESGHQPDEYLGNLVKQLQR